MKKPQKPPSVASAELAALLSVENNNVDVVDEVDETSPQLVLPTASKTDRFIGCAWPWGQPVVDNNVGPEARFGSAFHEVMEFARKHPKFSAAQIQKAIKTAAARYDDVDAAAVADRFFASYKVLKAWLSGENPWHLNFEKNWKLEYESALALNVETMAARRCAKPTLETHEYPDRLDGEIPGTHDLLGLGSMTKAAAADCVLVLDYKSGFDVGAPTESGQLLTLALTACRFFKVNNAVIAFLHAPSFTEPTIYADSIGWEALQQHIDALTDAHCRAGDGSMRPGFYCKYCQVFSKCPVNQTALVELRGKKALSTPERVGEAHQKLKEAEKRFAALHDVVDSEIRSFVAQNGFAIRPDGGTVEFVEREYSQLSQKSITDALGNLKGKKLLHQLEELGCIRRGVRKELRVK